MGETWKPIEGYDIYEVSNRGRVKKIAYTETIKNKYGGYSVRHQKEYIKKLTPNKQRRGYLVATLSKDNKTKTHWVHQLVAKAFIPNPENKPQVNHKDGNKKNNTVDNLEWSTPMENVQHGIKNGLIQPRKPNKRWRKIICVETGNVYECSRDAAKAEGANWVAIRNVLCGNAQTAGGKHWIIKKDNK